MKRIILFIVIVTKLVYIYGNDKPCTIVDFENIPIQVKDTFSGQSFTLITKENRYCILREMFGSGVPVACWIIYETDFDSEYQVRFERIESTSNIDLAINEIFILKIDNGEVKLYLNGLQLEIND